MQCQGFEQSGTLKKTLSVHAPYSRTMRVKHIKRGLPHAEVTQKTDTKGEAYRMFLHRDNPMQCQGFEQSGTLKISLSVHAPYSRTRRVKKKGGSYPMQMSPRRQKTKEKLTGCYYTEIIPCSVKGLNKVGPQVNSYQDSGALCEGWMCIRQLDKFVARKKFRSTKTISLVNFFSIAILFLLT